MHIGSSICSHESDMCTTFHLGNKELKISLTTGYVMSLVPPGNPMCSVDV